MPHQADVAVGAHADGLEIPPPAGIEQRVPDLGTIGQAVDDDIEPALAELLPHPGRDPFEREIAALFVALVLAHVGRRVGQRVVGGVQRIDPLELHGAAVTQAKRLGHLAALEQVLEDRQRGRPGAYANRGAGLGERLGDGKPEPGIIGNTGHEGALAAEVDREHRFRSMGKGRPEDKPGRLFLAKHRERRALEDLGAVPQPDGERQDDEQESKPAQLHRRQGERLFENPLR